MNRILIVDDSATIRKMVKASLQAVPSPEFVEAETGLQAIEQLALGPVGLIVLDLNMPDMHGIDVLKFVRRHRTCERVPAIVLTTRSDDSSRATAREAGATAYMTKPFNPHALGAAARTLLASSQRGAGA